MLCTNFARSVSVHRAVARTSTVRLLLLNSHLNYSRLSDESGVVMLDFNSLKERKDAMPNFSLNASQLEAIERSARRARSAEFLRLLEIVLQGLATRVRGLRRRQLHPTLQPR